MEGSVVSEGMVDGEENEKEVRRTVSAIETFSLRSFRRVETSSRMG